MQVALAAEGLGELRWVTRQGDVRSQNLVGGWLSAVTANELPFPDIAWMDRPIPRANFIEWLS